MNNQSISPVRSLAWFGVFLLVLAVVVGVGVGGCAGLKAFGRAQARADAHNKVSLTEIQIQNQQQYARVIAAQNQVVKQQAYQRYLESIGIRESQNEIAKTLTPLYVQYEAIQAEKAVATSGQNNTVVYVPAGQAGVPLITANAGTGK